MESQYHMNGSKTHQRKALDLMAMEIHWGSMDMLVIILFGMLVDIINILSMFKTPTGA